MSKKFAVFALLSAVFSLGFQVIPTVAAAQSFGYGGGGGGGIPSIIGIVNGSPAPFAPQTGGEVLGASVYNFTQTLRRGSAGQDVIELQKILIAGGFLNIDSPNGYFGPATEAAVKAYQAAHGIEATGIVGPLTRALLNKGTAPTAALQTGAAATTVTPEHAVLIQRFIWQIQGLLARLRIVRSQQ